MNTIRPEIGFERLLVLLERDLLEASDEEILSAANELGIKPGMKGSIAQFGVTIAARSGNQKKKSRRQGKSSGSSMSRTPGRRGLKRDAPPET